MVTAIMIFVGLLAADAICTYLYGLYEDEDEDEN